jgi:hypothetical protein
MCERDNKGLYVVAWKNGRKDAARKPGRYREIQYSFEKQSGRMSGRLLDITDSVLVILVIF